MNSDPLSIQRSKTIIGDQIGDDTIVINTLTGAYYSLTPEAGKLWTLTENGSSSCPPDFIEIARHLIREGIFETGSAMTDDVSGDPGIAYVKYSEMADILLADPIHEVDEDGWPKIR